ncbi:hypothetical protein AX764_04405 [Oenococcus oeni]|nr:hypothetical protein AX764_04405 [Oenococcus oeni]
MKETLNINELNSKRQRVEKYLSSDSYKNKVINETLSNKNVQKVLEKLSVIATIAAIIASQALITGSYTLVSEAIGLKV